MHDHAERRCIIPKKALLDVIISSFRYSKKMNTLLTKFLSLCKCIQNSDEGKRSIENKSLLKQHSQQLKSQQLFEKKKALKFMKQQVLFYGSKLSCQIVLTKSSTDLKALLQL
ncbi:hypothetical protein T01_13837 [Trichinella spiralis]|uniref:Uncharacterized protein n=1 Tax=Trichinella spiralis TaxID=6334 RepID=A0A0V1BSD0_TRISP|nr:hypothetical protein T01_13837 [Trichinella spiralis]